ncbi:hypothetical protein SBOR_7312 [Sclerotinia borealis F-4128]|uniref:Uncharacterized protein n=1 Tax=Sclerotinia borealis (strain F-4128) TaxID=1432307 RepID=W9C916_SCLBF|nr:hypothetical protein SBOR_7312 [Sclerotinia borealis F-4128]
MDIERCTQLLRAAPEVKSSFDIGKSSQATETSDTHSANGGSNGRAVGTSGGMVQTPQLALNASSQPQALRSSALEPGFDRSSNSHNFTNFDASTIPMSPSESELFHAWTSILISRIYTLLADIDYLYCEQASGTTAPPLQSLIDLSGGGLQRARVFIGLLFSIGWYE